jgi:hypothetical protein
VAPRRTRLRLDSLWGLPGLAVASGIGLAVGSGSVVLQAWLPGSGRVLNNSGAVWAFAVFALALHLRPRLIAVAGGALALVAASFSYYATLAWYSSASFSLGLAMVWSLVGIAVGSALGQAGFVARRSGRHRALAGALFAGGLFGEGLHLVSVRNQQLHPVGVAELCLATFLAALCLRTTTWQRSVTIAASSALATLLAFSLVARAIPAG